MNKIFDWLALFVVIFFGACVLGGGVIVFMAFEWWILPVILGVALVSWAIVRVLEIV